jgi:hypothetical protein
MKVGKREQVMHLAGFVVHADLGSGVVPLGT